MKSMLIPEYKVVMLGTGGVGKSMLTTRFINGEFSHEYDPTIEDSYRKQCQIDGDICVLDILDTAGQEEYAAMRDYHIRSGHGFIIVYSVTSMGSLKEAEKIAEHVRRVKDSDKVAIVLVGNKCDLEEMRTVPTLEGEKTARRMRSGFYETSAKRRVNVDDMFIQSVRRIKYFGKRTSGTGSSTSQESKGSTQSKRETVKPDAKLNYTKSWLPAKRTTPPPAPEPAPAPALAPAPVVEDTNDIIDSYYAMSDEYRAPCPAPNRRLTATPEKTRAVSQMPDRQQNARGKSMRPPARNTEDLPAKTEEERPVIRLVGYGTDAKKLQQKSTANVNKALPKRRRQWQAHACPIL